MNFKKPNYKNEFRFHFLDDFSKPYNSKYEVVNFIGKWEVLFRFWLTFWGVVWQCFTSPSILLPPRPRSSACQCSLVTKLPEW